MFPDYLLAPTLMEFSTILNIPISPRVPYHTAMEKPSVSQTVAALCLGESIVDDNRTRKGPFYGYHLSFLLKEANTKADNKDWKGFNAILACCIYGMVLFFNKVKFVDENVVALFILKNTVPTLLGMFIIPYTL